ncbi:MAG TPA: 6,7-dimethyl-8-ribityllumazine synthase [Actinomycetota bacterium]|nr:6,7-dimethyl-8-ribityllumazine synthase [Actinomycetota bacterium]
MRTRGSAGGAEGGLEGRGRRFAVAASRFNDVVTSRLVDGALAALRRHGVAEDDIDVAWTPGAFELPVVALRLARSDQFDAVICLGAVIRGETMHFDLVAQQAAEGIQRAALETGVPCIFGVLATETLEQALDRAGGKHGNKGWEAATAALEMAGLMDELPKQEG